MLSPPSWKWTSFPRRYLIAIMAFFGFFNIYSLRVNLSIAIVAMTENRTTIHANGTIGYVRTQIAAKQRILPYHLFSII